MAASLGDDMARTRTEALVVTDGLGDVEICAGDGDVVLLVDDQPVTLTWPAHHPHRNRLFFRGFDASELATRLAGMALCTDGVDPNLPLAVQLRPLLRLLVDGVYDAHLDEERGVEFGEVTLDEPAQPYSYLEWAGLHQIDAEEALLLGSIPRSLLDPIAIRDVVGRIRSGRRPAVIGMTCPTANATFLLHGHVAMEAYMQVGVAPTMLVLSYRTPRRLQAEEAAVLLRRATTHFGEVLAAHYQAARDTARRPVLSGP
jgi:hypothetical protein